MPAPNARFANQQSSSVEADAVISWVDGQDPMHAAKRLAAKSSINSRSLHYLPSGQDSLRYTNNDEIRYCVYSIRRFMPWIRNIYVVTDNQVPEFLTDDIQKLLRVRIVDHKEIFKSHEDVLPTFNSRTIETAIHRIEGIADHYVYFNDDFVVLKPTPISEFFENGKIVLRGDWHPLNKHGPLRMLVSGILNKVYKALRLRERAMATLPQYKAATIAGLKNSFIKYPHAPYPVNTSTIRNFFEQNPQFFRHNIQYKFRSMHQFVTHPLAAALEVKNGGFILSERKDYVMLRFSRKEMIDSDINELFSGDHRFACLQGLECATLEIRRKILHFLDRRVFGTDI